MHIAYSSPFIRALQVKVVYKILFMCELISRALDNMPFFVRLPTDPAHWRPASGVVMLHIYLMKTRNVWLAEITMQCI